MNRTPCESCGEWMFEGAVTCPHCGSRQEGRDPMRQGTPMAEQATRKLEASLEEGERKPVSVSREEAAALIQFSNARRGGPDLEDTRGGVATWMVMPQLSGRARMCEIALTVVCLPLIGFLFLYMAFISLRRWHASSRGLARMGAVPAALGLFGIIMVLGASMKVAAVIVLGMFLAWVVREILRARFRPRLDV